MLNIDIPKLPEPSIDRIPGLFRIDKPLKKTTRKVILKTSMGKFDWSPSLSYIKDLNYYLRKSYSGYALFCFPEPNVLYIIAPSNEDSDFACQLLQGGDPGTARAFTIDYVKKAGRLVAKEFILGDKLKIGLIEWKDNPLDD